MNDSLFDIPESKSPRLIWMEKHQITVELNEATGDCEAWSHKKQTKSESVLGCGPTELDAIADLACKLNIPLWNEQ